VAAAIALPMLDAIGATGAGGSGAGVEMLLPWLVAAWFVGASIIAIRAFMHWRRLSWLARHASIPLTDWTQMLDKLRRRFGVARPVRLLGSMAIDTPMLIGWLRPVILLPLGMLSGFTPQQIELIIAHELGHVRRWDYLANLLQVVIETVLFYHPVVHWISREVREARESCCDDLVLALGEGSPVVYASALAELEQLRHDGALAAPALGAGGGVLLERIRRIVGAQSVLYDPLPRSGGWPIALLVAMGMLAVLRLHAPADVATVIAQAPATSVVAAISGNPRLADAAPAATSSIETAAVVTTPDATAREKAQPTPSAASIEREAPVLPLARPKVTVAAAVPALPRATDIRERVSALPVLAPSSEPAVAAPAVPVALQRVQPDYPVREKIRGVTGKVDLQFGIDSDGGVRDVTVLDSTPEHVFDNVAIAALKRWRFAAPADAGQRYTQSFAFTLGTHPAPTEPCREVIGSHICRHVAAGEDSPP
jgi:TonB family protein